MANTFNVLLVEDNEDDAELLAHALKRGGLQIAMTRVETAEDFRSTLMLGEWSFILSDFNLPSFNASEALEIVQDVDNTLPFIIVSGAVSAKDAVTVLKAGAHDFIEKSEMSRLVPAIEREMREVKLRRERKKEQAVFQMLYRAVEQSPVSVMITDETGCVEYVNRHYSKVTGVLKEEAMGQLPDVMAGDFVSLEQNAAVWEAVKNGNEWRGEFCNQRKNGDIFWEYVNVAPISNDDGCLKNLLILKEDITFRKEAEEKIYRQANFDELTRLPNRTLILQRLGQELEQHDYVALVTVDLDNFKKINNSLGHKAGDAMLMSAANRLRESLESFQTIGRISGDEFAIVLADLDSSEEIELQVSKILDAFDAPFDLNGHELFVSVRAGITVYPQDGRDPAVLLKNSEAAMRQAKEGGKSDYCFFSSHMNQAAEERLVLEAALRKALERNELELYYQPIVDAEEERMAGAEALIRWNHPTMGVVYPDTFIPLAEETGLIVPIGQWVIESACQAINAFHQSGLDGIYVSVNVSPQQIWSKTLVDVVKQAIKTYEIDPSYLVLEVTESVCIADTDLTLDALQQMSAQGVRMAVDDFGTGYSSLSYLKSYPFDILKIDRAFIMDVPENKDDVALVNAMVAMGKSLGLMIVAEGVETGDHAAFLKGIHCNLLQGYHYSRPTPFDDFLNSNLNSKVDSKVYN